MKEFEFKMNEYKDVMYIFVDENKPPIDTALLVEYKKDDGEEILSTWMPKSYDVQIMAGLIFIGADDIKEFYNDNYDKILELIYPKSMLQKPLVIDGFYLDSETGGIEQTGLAYYKKGGFGVTYSYEQAEGIVAFCELTQILPVFNEGWEPTWKREKDIKWCIIRVDDRYYVVDKYYERHLLAFKTKEKAELFLKLKKPLVIALSDAGII